MSSAGAQVTVLEQAESLREVGAGLQITPNGARVIRALGLSGELAARSLTGVAVQPMDALTGRSIARFPLPSGGAGYHLMHRGDLLGLLSRAAGARGVTIRTGCRVIGAEPDGSIDTGAGAISSDLVIGADGVHSVLRGVIDPEAPAAAFTGQVAWRAVVLGADSDPSPRIWMGLGRHIVTYPLPGGVTNIVAVEERSGWAAEGWHHPDTPENLRRAFGDVCPELAAILARVETVHLWGLFRHPVARHWHRGRLAILGDAAHPTLPFLAQGANLALEDAMILARCLADPSADDPLALYQALRRGRAVRAIDAANANARNYHLKGPARVIAHAGLSLLGRLAPARFIARYDWLYGYEPASVPLRP